MRFLLISVAAAALFGCSRESTPAAEAAAAPPVDTAAPAPAAEYDSLSYAEPDKVRIEDLALELELSFDKKELAGTATYRLDWRDPRAAELVLDTRDLAIAKVTAEQADGTWLARIKAPPVDGKANAELLELIAEHFGVRKGAVSISR